MTQRSLTEKLLGTEELDPLRRTLRAGLLTAELDAAGNLGSVTYDGCEILRGVSFLVRDRGWGTITAQLKDLEVHGTPDRFVVSYQTTCREGPAEVQSQVRIVGGSDGQLTFTVQIQPLTDFLTARTGLCVLHPLIGLAGAPIEVEHTDGRKEEIVLPRLVSPHQPVFDIRALTHRPRRDLRVTVRMEGDTFEMEDQRNWSDASFKTYVRPLGLPYPYTLPAQQTLEQAVHIQIYASEKAPQARARIEERALLLRPNSVLGRMPSIGIGLDRDGILAALSMAPELTRLGAQRVLARLDARTDPLVETLGGYADLCRLTGADLVLELVVPCVLALEEELAQVAAAVQMVELPLSALVVSPAADLKKDSPHEGILPPLAELYKKARTAFPGVPLGGGMFANFTELNRKRPPAELLDFVTHTTCPIIHAADDKSVLSTLEALPWIFESTRAFIGDRPYCVGPVSLGMRGNAYGELAAPNPHQQRVPMAALDPRQKGLFAAAFYTAYAAHAVRAQLSALSFCAPTGIFGLIEGSQLVPAFHVVRALAQGAGAQAVQVSAPPGTEALAWRRGEVFEVLLCNLSDQPASLSIENEQASAVAVAVLDANSFEAASKNADYLDGFIPQTAGTLTLGAYAVARMRWVLHG